MQEATPLENARGPVSTGDQRITFSRNSGGGGGPPHRAADVEGEQHIEPSSPTHPPFSSNTQIVKEAPSKSAATTRRSSADSKGKCSIQPLRAHCPVRQHLHSAEVGAAVVSTEPQRADSTRVASHG
jgi:hypothetical protein